MSYEGYNQQICENGHYQKVDVYDRDEGCRYCEGIRVFETTIDQTNDEGNPLSDNQICQIQALVYKIKRLEEEVEELEKDMAREYGLMID